MNKPTAVAATLVAALALPAAAGAEPSRWLSEGRPIPAGETVTVTASSPVSIQLKRATGEQITKAKCTMHYAMSALNAKEHGRGRFSGVGLSGCEETVRTPTCVGGELQARGTTTWPYVLQTDLASPTSFTQEVLASLEVSCTTGANYGVFTGTLLPTPGDFDEPSASDDEDHTLRFKFTLGALREPSSGDTVGLSGIANYRGPAGNERVSAERG